MAPAMAEAQDGVDSAAAIREPYFLYFLVTDNARGKIELCKETVAAPAS
jgi:hypothetical protein